MKLKLIVVSLGMIGLINSQAFAVTPNNDTPIKKTSASKSQTQHIVNENGHRHYNKEEHSARDYKDMPSAALCIISQPEMILNEMTQSMGRSMPSPCTSPGWADRIQVSGGINIDLGKFGNRTGGYQGENYKRFSLNDAYLNVGANINEWTHGFASLSYGDPTSTDFTDSGAFEYSSVYNAHQLTLEQAYATIANFNASPLFLQVGKQFQDFSRYDIHPITRSMTQVLSETLRTSVKVGFIVPFGFNGAIYAFDNTIRQIGKHYPPTDYGASLGIDRPNDQFGWDIGVGYMRNMISAKDVAHAVTNFTGVRAYNQQVGGIALYGDVNSGPFYLSGRYTGAANRFAPEDLPKNGEADIGNPAAHGAKPWALGVEIGVGFVNVLGWNCPRNQKLYAGYQSSHQAAGIGLPRSRWIAGYGIEALKNTNFGLEWDHDNAYAESSGGNNQHHNDIVTIRAAFQFG
jgi:hypothetical protein